MLQVLLFAAVLAASPAQRRHVAMERSAKAEQHTVTNSAKALARARAAEARARAQLEKALARVAELSQ